MLPFIYTHMVTLLMLLLQVDSSSCLMSFHINLKDSLQYFLYGKSTSNKFSELLLTWECLNFLLHFARYTIIYLFIYLFIISHQFYTHQCIHVNPNRPIQHTTIPTPQRFSPLGVHTFVLYICVSTSALQTHSSVPFFQVPHTCVNIRYLFLSF